jgi:hypothetical protein
MTKTLPFAPPDPERRWSTERRDYLRTHWPQNIPTTQLMAVLNSMTGLPINVNQASAYAGRQLKIVRHPIAIQTQREEAAARMARINKKIKDAIKASRSGMTAADLRRQHKEHRARLRRQQKEANSTQMAAKKAERAAVKAAQAEASLSAVATEQRRIAEKRNRLTELFMADQQRLDILRMQQERKAAELVASKSRSKPKPERPRRDPSEQPKTFTMTAMQMPDPRLAAYREQCGAASRGRVADSYVAPLTRTLPE